jgi:hypothetical protein
VTGVQTCALPIFFIEPRKGDSGNIHAKLEARMKQKGKKEDIEVDPEKEEAAKQWNQQSKGYK